MTKESVHIFAFRIQVDIMYAQILFCDATFEHLRNAHIFARKLISSNLEAGFLSISPVNYNSPCD